MGNRPGRRLSSREMEMLLTSSSYSVDRILDLHREFRQQFPSGYIDRRAFMQSYRRHFPDGDRRFVDRLFDAHDINGDGVVSFSEFLVSLDVAQNGSVEDKLRWTFKLYDVDNSGTVSSYELSDVLEAMYKLRGVPDARRRAKSNGRRIMRELDVDGDGSLTLNEFLYAAVRHRSIVDLIDGRIG